MEHVPVEITSDDQFNISGRGIVYTFNMSQLGSRVLKINDIVKLNGRLCRVTAIEQFRPRLDGTPGRAAGITVRFLDESVV